MPEGFFAAEAAGLRWLREAGAVAVPEVFVVLPDLLALDWVEPGEPTPEAAERFGRELAGLHRAGATTFGATWPGFIGSLPQDNTPTDGHWSTWFAERRLTPPAALGRRGRTDQRRRHSYRAGGRSGRRARRRRAARTHPRRPVAGQRAVGSDDRAWLVDPAAHGGHRETDLAQLALFGGIPYLDRVLAAYQEVWPLAAAGATGCPCTNCICCSCTPRSSVAVTAMWSSRPPGPSWAGPSALRSTGERHPGPSASSSTGTGASPGTSVCPSPTSAICAAPTACRRRGCPGWPAPSC
ncbi:fructosamine kinase family protein [Micromonospora sp. M12]